MRSMRDSRRPYLPAVQAPIDALYWGGAIVSGLIIGLDLFPWPLSFAVLLAIGIGVTLVGWRVEGGVENHRPTSWLWGLIFVAVWLSIAFIRHSFPFGP
jgi:hypothetical protein